MSLFSKSVQDVRFMRKIYKASTFLPYFLLLAFSHLTAQGQDEVTVDKFTGTAHVTIPLYMVQARGVSLPLSLHYTASGIKVEEAGRSQAIGWTLAGLPRITREVRDLPDDIVADNGTGERRFGWLAPGRNVPAKAAALPSPSLTTACSGVETTALVALNAIAGSPFSENASHDIYDAEPDIFFYSVPGHSGKFVFDGQLRIQLIPYDNVYITYTRDADASLRSFEVTTPEGHRYTFDVKDRVQEKTSAQQAPPFFYRHYFTYKLDAGLTYCTTWHVSDISLPQQARDSGFSPRATVVSFSYRLFSNSDAGSEPKQLFWSGTVIPQTMYTTKLGSNTHQLSEITTSTTTVNFNFDNHYETAGGPLTSIYVNARAGGQTTIVKQIQLNYTLVSTTPGRARYDSYGTEIEPNPALWRNFLSDISISNGCTPLAAYSFDYQSPGSLPPADCVERDYWGYYNGNQAQTPVPQLYVYPQLEPGTTPGGAYRLFEAPTLSGGLVLPGADRRPAQTLADFQQTTLAGTLTSVKLPTGGKISLDYEPHRFYDPVAQAYYNGGGVRVKAVHWQDNLGGAEQVREYQYGQAVGGESSGRLLHVPRLAITSSRAATQPSSLAQWQAATITALDDLAPDPFESRTVGYGRVVERVAGRGQSVHTFSLAALPEDAVAPGYLRTTTGLARETGQRRSPGCPATGLYQPGAEVYPFLQATNYEQERGNLLEISQQSEPLAGGASQTVQRDAFQYGYVPVGTDGQVRGVNYEPLTATPGVFAYTSYLLKTGFIYTLLSQTHSMADQTRPSQFVTTATRYRYNDKGQVITTVKQTSDGNYLRTRLKYAADFANTTAPAGPALAAVRQRVNAEHITQELVETIAEVVSPGSGPRITSVVTNTFLLEGGCTRPYQQFNWQPAQPVPTNSSAYDSTRIQNVGGTDELVVNSQVRQRPTITFEKVTQQLVVTDAYTTSGRRRAASLPAADGTSIKLQVQNAQLAEVLFSDFENQTTRDFAYNGTLISTTAHTGSRALDLTNATLTHSLPESTRSEYRLSLWAQSPAGSAASVAVTIDGTPTASQRLQAGTGWQLLEIPLSLASLAGPRASHTLQIAPGSGSTLLVDDVLLLPALATAASTTFDGQYRKTSQTDATNQTLYYSYDPAGNEAIISDHNKSIIKQVTKVVAGRAPAYSLDFSVVGELADQLPATLLASSGCLPNVQYTWQCVDPATGQTIFTTPASSNPTLSYTFSTGGQTKDFRITVTATTAGRQLTQTRTLTVLAGPWQVQLATCGTTGLDACTGTYYSQPCNDGVPPDNHITFTAAVSNYAACSALVYSWEIAYGNAGAAGNWQALTNPAGNSPRLDMPCGSQSFRVRCTVRGCNRVGVSEESGYTVNYRDASGQLCDGVPTGTVINRPGY